MIDLVMPREEVVGGVDGPRNGMMCQGGASIDADCSALFSPQGSRTISPEGNFPHLLTSPSENPEDEDFT